MNKYLPSPKLMTDKERILSAVIHQLSFNWAWSDGQVEKDKPRIERLNAKSVVKPGSLIISDGTGLHPQTIGYFVSWIGSSEYLVRGISNDKVVRHYNDSFSVICNIDPDLLLEGKQYKAYRCMRLALEKDDRRFWYRYPGCQFTGNDLVVTIREKWDGYIDDSTGRFVNETFDITLPVKNSSIKLYEQLMMDQGVGSREFRVWDTKEKVFISKEEYRAWASTEKLMAI
jgi:hypothetical protein